MILLGLFTISCKNVPDNKIYATKTEKGDWVVPTPGTAPVQKVDEFVLVSPTWGQAFAFAKLRGDARVYDVLAGVLFLAFILVVIGRTTNANGLPEIFYHGVFGNVILGALFFLSVYFFANHAIGIKNSNDKWVKKDVYEKAMKETGSTQPIWDSLQTNCLIVDGPYNCYQK